MPVYRKTAIVQLELPSGAMESSLPLTCEREFGVILSIAGKTYPAQSFSSPINDEQWREFVRQLRACNVNHDEKTGYRGATAIRALARTLYQVVDIGAEIPGDLFEAVARVLAFIMTLRARGSASGIHTVRDLVRR